MKLEGYRKDYYNYSSKTSDVVRNLGFAGIAIIWIFKTDVEGKYSIPAEFLPAGTTIIFSLFLDLLHCVIGTAIWGIFQWRKDQDPNVTEDEDIEAPKHINLPANILFWGKIITMLIGYLLLLCILGKMLTIV